MRSVLTQVHGFQILDMLKEETHKDVSLRGVAGEAEQVCLGSSSHLVKSRFISTVCQHTTSSKHSQAFMTWEL